MLDGWRRPENRQIIVLGLLIVVAVAWRSLTTTDAAAVAPARPRVVTVLEHAPEEEAWFVDVTMTRLDPAEGRVEAYFTGWGLGLADGADHVVRLDARGRPMPDDAGPPWFLPVPESGRVELHYRVRLLPMGGEEAAAAGLRPQLGDYAFGYSWNTIVQLSQGGYALGGDHHLELRAGQGVPVVTGWRGRTTARQRLTWPSPAGNGPLAFGEPARVLELPAGEGGPAVEVYQYGAGPDATAAVGEVVQRALPVMAALFGRAPPSPYRAFVTAHGDGGMSSHAGLRVTVRAEQDPAVHASPWFRRLVVHELLHFGLGHELDPGGEHLAWVHEGFTEYLALWVTAVAGHNTREEFARAVLEHEQLARGQSTLGEVAFADETDWRDDGPRETQAYSGGALLGLALDVELRQRGHSGLGAFVRDRLAAGADSFTIDDLRTWLKERGLGARYAASVAGTELPPAEELLALAGFRRGPRPVDLAYVGLRTEEADGGRVRAVDPDGPAARAGVREGDVITGLFPLRQDGATVKGRAPRHDFGLTLFEPGRPGAYLGVRRGDEDLQLPVEPERLEGAGRAEGWIADGGALDLFFASPP